MEKGSPFLRALGKGPSALLRRASGGNCAIGAKADRLFILDLGTGRATKVPVSYTGDTMIGD